jgi:hypothetical protein
MKTVVDFESFLYAQDILHLDIHPRNILLTLSSLIPRKNQTSYLSTSLMFPLVDQHSTLEIQMQSSFSPKPIFPLYYGGMLPTHVTRYSKIGLTGIGNPGLKRNIGILLHPSRHQMRELFLPQSFLEREHERRQQHHNSPPHP